METLSLLKVLEEIELKGRQNKIVKTRYGSMIINQFDTVVGRSLDLYGEWAQLEMELLKKFIPKDGICIDVGANVGCHSLVFAEAVGPRGTVLAFEPQHCIFQILSGNIALNSHVNVWTYPCAVSDHLNETPVPRLSYRRKNSFGGLSLKKDWSNGPTYLVPTVKLDIYTLPRVDLIKIDVEGADLDVIRGAKGMIQRHQPVLYVENSSLELIPEIQALDYKVYDFHSLYYSPTNYKMNPKNIFGDVGDGYLLCIPKSKNIS